MTLRSLLKALSAAFVRLAEAIEADPLDGLESRIARLERAVAAGAATPDPGPPSRQEG